MNLIIRPERPGDEDAIRTVTLAAFAGHPHSAQTEHLIIERLRTAGKLAVSLVAAEDGVVIGHIAFSPVRIGLASEGWYGLAPLAVAPRRQNRGIGTRLVREGLASLKEKGAAGCVVLGEPGYYGRFGFSPDPAITLQGPPAEYFQTLSFGPDRPEGETYFDDAFAES
jgi:predicted N-acetyltransferase YhbS